MTDSASSSKIKDEPEAGPHGVSEAVSRLIDIDFNPAEIRARYRAERHRRIRSDGNAQYVETVDTYAAYADDPFVTQRIDRAPVTDHVQCAIIGGGFGGLLMGARLRDAGFDDIRIVEFGSDFGGAWYWNRYPGAMCDTESYCYLPLLEELNYIPRHRYAYAPEVRAHSANIARRYRLYDNALLQTAVTSLAWDGDERRWVVRTDRGDAFTAQFVFVANGPFTKPKLPGIPGIADFRGRAFHTSRWDYGYTGGDASGNLAGLADRNVAIIGTGATAIQCVPHLGASAGHLYVFQRTPSSVDYRANPETAADFAVSIEPGWQKRRISNFTALLSGVEQDEDLVQDGWTKVFQILTKPAIAEAARRLGRELTTAEAGEFLEMADHRQMNRIRARIGQIVDDPDVAAALMPWYRQFCKRPGFHDTYLETFNRPNVTLVDTLGRGVERITATSLIANGREYPADCIIFATGFEVGTSFTRRAGYEIAGRNGRLLSDHWRNGLRTFHGLASHGFPNCFFLGNTQTAVTINATHMLDEQTHHVAHLLKTAVERGGSVIEPTSQAEQAYVTEIRTTARFDDSFYRECTPSYYNAEGQPQDGPGLLGEAYGLGPVPFFRMLAEWREDGRLAGYTVR